MVEITVLQAPIAAPAADRWRPDTAKYLPLLTLIKRRLANTRPRLLQTPSPKSPARLCKPSSPALRPNSFELNTKARSPSLPSRRRPQPQSLAMYASAASTIGTSTVSWPASPFCFRSTSLEYPPEHDL